jgi:metal-sulfur cluster biosynthetic enzyme
MVPRAAGRLGETPDGKRANGNTHLSAVVYLRDMATQEEIKEEVTEALKTVNDPELGIDILNLGLVYEVDVDESNNVKVDFTLTTMGCPIAPMIDAEIKQATSMIEGIGEVSTELVMYPPWSPEKMSPLARSALGFV